MARRDKFQCGPCFNFASGLELLRKLHSLRQLLANAAIAASRVGS